MDRALLDTDTLSEISKGKNAAVRERATRYLATFRSFSISTVSVLEVVKGLHKLGRKPQLERFLASLGGMEVLPLDEDAAVLAGMIYGDLERTGQPIGRADPMIAGIAMARGLVLVTGNIEHFKRITDLGHALVLENWIRP